MLITPNLALLVFAVVLIVSASVAWRYKNYQTYDKCWFHTFIATLTGLGVFVTFMFYYNVVFLQSQQQEIAAIETISDLNATVLNSVLKDIKSSVTVIPNFVLSITPLTNTICSTTASPDPITPETCTYKMILSYRIFSLWQDILMTQNVLPISYIANFLQRANSSQLYDQWLVNRLNFTSKTQTFGDLLFKYGLPITIQTPQSYISASEQLVADPIYINSVQSCHDSL